MTTPLEVREYVEQRLDMDYTRDVAAAIGGALRAGQTIGANWQPGDGTSYRLVFVPAPALLAPPRVKDGKEWERQPMTDPARSTIVAWLGHGAHELDLRSGGFVGPYLCELFGCAGGSGAALSILLDAVAAAFREAAPDA